jgi:hypothetical protein
LTIKGKAYIAGIYEHPTRHAPDKSTAQLHAEVAKGAIEDAGLTKADIDGYFCAGDAPGGLWPMVDYLGLKVRHMDSTDTGGCSYLIHVGHAAEAIAAGKHHPVRRIPKHKREFAAQAMQALRAEVFIEMQCDFAVRPGAQAMARLLEFLLDCFVAIEFAVDDNPALFVFACDWLITGRKIDDAETSMPEGDALIG